MRTAHLHKLVELILLGKVGLQSILVSLLVADGPSFNPHVFRW